MNSTCTSRVFNQVAAFVEDTRSELDSPHLPPVLRLAAAWISKQGINSFKIHSPFVIFPSRSKKNECPHGFVRDPSILYLVNLSLYMDYSGLKSSILFFKFIVPRWATSCAINYGDTATCFLDWHLSRTRTQGRILEAFAKIIILTWVWALTYESEWIEFWFQCSKVTRASFSLIISVDIMAPPADLFCLSPPSFCQRPRQGRFNVEHCWSTIRLLSPMILL